MLNEIGHVKKTPMGVGYVNAENITIAKMGLKSAVQICGLPFAIADIVLLVWWRE